MCKAESVRDEVFECLQAVEKGKEGKVTEPLVVALKKRQLLKTEAWKTYRLSKTVMRAGAREGGDGRDGRDDSDWRMACQDVQGVQLSGVLHAALSATAFRSPRKSFNFMTKILR